MVKIKHKVTIKRKVAQEESLAAEQARVTIEQEQPDTVTATPPIVNPDDGGKKGGKGIWIAAAVAVAALAIGGGGYYFATQNGTNDGSQESTEEVVTKTSGDQESSAKETSDDVTAQNDGAETPATTDGTTGDNPTTGHDTGNGAVENPAKGATQPQDAKQQEPTTPTAKENPAKESSAVAQPKPAATTVTADVTDKPSTNERKTSVTRRTDSPTGSIEQEALSVIRGDYGVGAERKELLGKRYAEIQRRVNQMYKKGLVR